MRKREMLEVCETDPSQEPDRSCLVNIDRSSTYRDFIFQHLFTQPCVVCGALLPISHTLPGLPHHNVYDLVRRKTNIPQNYLPNPYVLAALDVPRRNRQYTHH